jgi:serine protease Do
MSEAPLRPSSTAAKLKNNVTLSLRKVHMPVSQKMRVLLVVVLAFIAAFGGTWTALESGWIDRTSTITKNQRTVVEQEGALIADVAKQVSPSVVSVTTQGTTPTGFFGQQQQSEGAGTGIIISSDGYVLTNKHVIPDGTTKVEVVTADGTTYSNVTVVGSDPSNDIAFLKINGAKNLRAATIGDSDKVQVGEKVVAIGNALGQFQNSVTQGIISGKGRPLQASDSDQSNDQNSESLTNLFQTDAAINPGNSGGPLVNMNGEIVGINTAVAENAQGIGFAIPINDAKGVIGSVLRQGKIVKPFLGVQYIMLNASVAKQLNASLDHGALVYTDQDSAVVSGSPADKAGIKRGDVITKINGKDLGDNYSLSSALGNFKPGDEVTLTIHRDGKDSDVKLTLTQYNK